MDVTSLGAGLPAQSESTDKSTLIGNYEAFLQLLVTQLKNQSPLEPLDANQFTQQLVQFSTVEQAVKTNDNLDRLISLQMAGQATAMVGFIGADIVAEGAAAELEDGAARWHYRAAGDGTATVTVNDADGNPVFTRETAISEGDGTFEWDGRGADGSELPDGQYSITIEARDADGNPVDVATEIHGTVTGLDFSGTEPSLKIGDIVVPISSLRSVTSGA